MGGEGGQEVVRVMSGGLIAAKARKEAAIELGAKCRNSSATVTHHAHPQSDIALRLTHSPVLIRIYPGSISWIYLLDLPPGSTVPITPNLPLSANSPVLIRFHAAALTLSS